MPKLEIEDTALLKINPPWEPLVQLNVDQAKFIWEDRICPAVDDELETNQVHLNCTHEGIIVDVIGKEGRVIFTKSLMVDELLEVLQLV